MIQSGELERVMEQFEKDAKRLPVYMGGTLTREAREHWTKQRYYENGRVNEIFTAYQCGYAFGKCAERML
jgi:hypothetical protein